MWLTILLGFISVVGLLATFYYGRKSIRLEQSKKRLEWSDIQSAGTDLAEKAFKDFKPDVCFTPGLRGATFANLLLGELGQYIPTYVGNTFALTDSMPEGIYENRIIATSKWRVCVPAELFAHAGSRIVIVDDFAMSGDFLQNIKILLESNGFQQYQIRTVCIATTKVALKTGKGPDHYWMQSDGDDFYFPWGRAN